MSLVSPGCTATGSPPRTPAEATPVRAEDTETPVEVSLTAVAEGVWLHTSVRDVAPYGRVVSHGVVLRGERGAVFIDSGWGPAATEALVQRVEQATGLRPTGAVLTDFHEDRSGGAAVLKAAGARVLSSQGVIDRIDADAFAEALAEPVAALSLDGVDLEVFAPGAGHTDENLVVWVPAHGLLFGGCLIRPFASTTLGNTADADLEAWGPSVRAVRARYPQAKVVVPSHGEPRGTELLDHTIELVEAAGPR